MNDHIDALHFRKFGERENLLQRTFTMDLKVVLLFVTQVGSLTLMTTTPSRKVIDIRDDGGILKTIKKEGDGELPTKNVRCEWVAKMMDGSVFSKEERRIDFGKDQVVKGLEYALQTMAEGEEADIEILPQYGHRTAVTYSVKVTQVDQEIRLPASSGDGPRVKIGGEGTKLTDLGPIVIREDGTMGRIDKWHEKTEKEQKQMAAFIRSRNRIRLKALGREIPPDDPDDEEIFWRQIAEHREKIFPSDAVRNQKTS